MNFPDAPAIGEVYLLAAKQWVWNGVGWAQVNRAALSGGLVFGGVIWRTREMTANFPTGTITRYVFTI